MWEECSTTCGEGVQIRSVYCQQVQQHDLISIVDSALCKDPRPSSVKICNQDVPCPKWEAGEWSQVTLALDHRKTLLCVEIVTSDLIFGK